MNTDKILQQIRLLSFQEKATLIKAIVDMMETDNFSDLASASSSSMDFWNNPVDDEVWNED